MRRDRNPDGRSERRRRQGEAWSNLISETSAESGALIIPGRYPNLICAALRPFLSEPHVAFWSAGERRNLVAVRRGLTDGYIELDLEGMGASCIVRPQNLHVQGIERDLSQSFLMLNFDDFAAVRWPSHSSMTFAGQWTSAREQRGSGNVIRSLECDTYSDTFVANGMLGRGRTGNVVIVSLCSVLNNVDPDEDISFLGVDAFDVLTLVQDLLANV